MTTTPTTTTAAPYWHMAPGDLLRRIAAAWTPTPDPTDPAAVAELRARAGRAVQVLRRTPAPGNGARLPDALRAVARAVVRTEPSRGLLTITAEQSAIWSYAHGHVIQAAPTPEQTTIPGVDAPTPRALVETSPTPVSVVIEPAIKTSIETSPPVPPVPKPSPVPTLADYRAPVETSARLTRAEAEADAGGVGLKRDGGAHVSAKLAAQITGDYAALGLAVPSDLLYSVGSAVVGYGYARAQEMRDEWADLPLVSEAAPRVLARIEAEQRAIVGLSSTTEIEARADGLYIAGQRYGLELAGLIDLLRYLTPTGGVDLREGDDDETRSRISWPSKAAAAILAYDSETAAEILQASIRGASFGPRGVQLWTRQTEHGPAIFGAVSGSHVAHGFDSAALVRMVQRYAPADARGSVDYDPASTTVRVDTRYPTRDAALGTGSITSAGIRWSTNDRGRGGINVAGVIGYNQCLNLVILGDAQIPGAAAKLTHTAPERKIRAAVQSATSRGIDAIRPILTRWGYRSEQSIAPVLDMDGTPTDTERALSALAEVRGITVDRIHQDDTPARVMSALLAVQRARRLAIPQSGRAADLVLAAAADREHADGHLTQAGTFGDLAAVLTRTHDGAGVTVTQADGYSAAAGQLATMRPPSRWMLDSARA